jgi:hypothetical protein
MEGVATDKEAFSFQPSAFSFQFPASSIHTSEWQAYYLQWRGLRLPSALSRIVTGIFRFPQKGASVEGHVIPATRRPKALGRRAKAGTQFLSDMDPRSPALADDKLRGGDGLTCISMGGPLAHDHSE